jgi:hypothetical protein
MGFAQTKPAVVDPYESFLSRPNRALPGQVIGIFVSDETYNFSVNEAFHVSKAYLATNPDFRPVAFVSGDGDYRQLSWHTENVALGQNANEPVAEKDGRLEYRQFASVCAADMSTANAHGVTAPFALAEIEVNGGDGSPLAATGFVATKIKVLNKTDAYKLDPAKIMSDAKGRFQKYKEMHAVEIESSISDAAKKDLGQKALTGPRESRDHALITWLPGSERVRISFQMVVVDGAYTITPQHKVGGFDTAMIVPAVRSGTQIGVSGGMALEFNKDGSLASEKELPLNQFSREVAVELPKQ